MRASPAQRCPARDCPVDSRRPLAVALGRFLAALHAVRVDAAAAHGVPLDTFDRLNTAARRTATSERLSSVVAAGAICPDERDAIEALLDAAPALTPAANAVVHGDLHAGQIIVDSDGGLAAVIDWGDVHVGDAAVDLAAVHAVLPVELHDAFLREYGGVDAARWAAARARAAWHTVALLAHAVDTREQDLAMEAMGALTRLCAGL